MDALMRTMCVSLRSHLRQVSKQSFFSHSATAESIRVRFAPSPTGFLHLGGLRTALYNYLFAKSKGGTFILRIEDTDQNRVVPGALEKIESMLEWTGVLPDEGPSQGGNYGPYIQSHRLELYQESIKLLLQNGTAYHCFCTPKRLDLLRKDASRRGQVSGYDNRCRHISPEIVKENLANKVPFVVRLKLEPTVEPWDDLVKGSISHNVADIEGDPVLMKSDGYPTYHLANVVDDHYMNISHVLRGDEWQLSTPKHILLYKAFGWQAPQFAHLPLIMNKDGLKLSKRQGDLHIEYFKEAAGAIVAGKLFPLFSLGLIPQSGYRVYYLEQIKEQGYLPEAVVSFVSTVGGGFRTNTSGLTLDQLVNHFDLEHVKRNPGRLDLLFLEEANKAHLSRLFNSARRSELLATLRLHVTKIYINKFESDLQKDILCDEYLTGILQWSIDEARISKLTDLIGPEFAFLWETPHNDQILALNREHPMLEVLTGLKQVVQGIETFGKEELTQQLRDHAKAAGFKINVYMQLIRDVISGLKKGPPVAEMMVVMGRDSTLRRINHALKVLHEEPTGQPCQA